jgi:hypothetical protein
MAIEIHTPSQPRHLKITQTMVDDFLIDPVLGVTVIFRVKLDAFQRSRLRYYWWVTDVIDSSGFGTGKSLTFWLFMNLRCIILGDQWACAYYQTFDAGKKIFWPYFTQFNARQAPLFAAQLGKVDTEGDIEGKDNTRGPACFFQHFRNESLIMMPAPNWMQEAKGQAGLTLNVAGIDEWTKVETMSKKTTKTTDEQGQAVGGINQQILGRVRRANYNQHHPLWGNHRLFLATAESSMHPANTRLKVFQREIEKGNPHYATISYSFKDVSNLKSHTGKPFREQIIDWNTISNMKATFTRAHFLREGLGIWAKETKGWYSEEALDRCVAAGQANGTEPEISRSNKFGTCYYFEGIDPAPALGKKSDDGAKAILRVRPRPGLASAPSSNVGDWLCEFVWAYRLRGKTTRQWSGQIHKKHQQFNFSGIMMDPNGGGQWIMGELSKTAQLIDGIERQSAPICSMDEPEPGNSHIILNLYKRGDAGVDALWPLLLGDDNLYEAMHVVFQEAVEHASVLFPVRKGRMAGGKMLGIEESRRRARPVGEHPGRHARGWNVAADQAQREAVLRAGEKGHRLLMHLCLRAVSYLAQDE